MPTMIIIMTSLGLTSRELNTARSTQRTANHSMNLPNLQTSSQGQSSASTGTIEITAVQGESYDTGELTVKSGGSVFVGLERKGTRHTEASAASVV